MVTDSLAGGCRMRVLARLNSSANNGFRFQLPTGVAVWSVNGQRGKRASQERTHGSRSPKRPICPCAQDFGGCAMSESSRPHEHIAAGPQDYADEAAWGRALLDRMDRLPGWPLSRFALVVLGLAYFFVFYDITDIGFGLPAIV